MTTYKLTTVDSSTNDDTIVGTKAVDANDFIISDDQTGKLFYDADGNGPDGMKQFALLSAHLKFSADLFNVGDY